MPWNDPGIKDYSRHMANSYRYWTGRDLLADSPSLSETLYNAPFVLISHGTEPDPVFRYANKAAQDLWQISWEDFTRMPSRLSAEQPAQDERRQMLEQAGQYGYISDYNGVRVTSAGKRFAIRNCTLWNVMDEKQALIGQAACFDRWEWL